MGHLGPKKVHVRPGVKIDNLNARTPGTDADYCPGRGVCAIACLKGALKLTRRTNRVPHPENVFEKVIPRSLEQGKGWAMKM